LQKGVDGESKGWLDGRLQFDAIREPWKFICVQLKTFQISIKWEIGIFRRMTNEDATKRGQEMSQGSVLEHSTFGQKRWSKLAPAPTQIAKP